MGYFDTAIQRQLEDDELAHHGILGQKWGIRRFQNYDGTRTEAGKKRYGTLKSLPKGPYTTKSLFGKEKPSKAGKEFKKQIENAFDEVVYNKGLWEYRQLVHDKWLEAHGAYYWNKFDSNSKECKLLKKYTDMCEKKDNEFYDGDQEKIKRMFEPMTKEQEQEFEKCYDQICEDKIWSKSWFRDEDNYYYKKALAYEDSFYNEGLKPESKNYQDLYVDILYKAKKAVRDAENNKWSDAHQYVSDRITEEITKRYGNLSVKELDDNQIYERLKDEIRSTDAKYEKMTDDILKEFGYESGLTGDYKYYKNPSDMGETMDNRHKQWINEGSKTVYDRKES